MSQSVDREARKRRTWPWVAVGVSALCVAFATYALWEGITSRTARRGLAGFDKREPAARESSEQAKPVTAGPTTAEPVTTVMESRVAPSSVGSARGRGSIRGRVLQPDGEPFSAIGASVTYEDPGRRLHGISYIEVGEDGRYRLDWVRPGIYTLKLSLSRFRRHSQIQDPWEGAVKNVAVTAGKTTDAGTLRMSLPGGRTAPITTINGEVLKPDGTPAAGAQITCCGLSCYGGEGWSDGKFSFGLEPGQVVKVTASLPGYRHAKVEVRYSGPTTKAVQMRLRKASARHRASLPALPARPEDAFGVLGQLGTVEGKLLGPDGSPLSAGRRGLFHYRVCSFSCLWHRGSRQKLEVWEGGRFRVQGISPGEYTFRCEVAGFAPAVVEEVFVIGGRTTRLDSVRLTTGLTLNGRVLKPDGSPAGGAAIFEGPPMDKPAATARPDGRFRIAHLPAEPVHVVASLPGWAPTFRVIRMPTRRGQRATIRLDPGALIQGIVRDTRGRPIAGERVHAGKKALWYELAATTRTDAAGFYCLRGVAPGEVSVLYLTVTVRSGQTTTVDLLRAAPAAIEGVLLRPDGTPVGPGQLCVTVPFMTAEGRTFHVPIRAGGRFRLDDVALEDFSCLVKVRGFRSARIALPHIGVGAQVRIAPIRLDEGLLRGRVLKPDGTAAAGASVTVQQPMSIQGAEWAAPPATSDARGYFVLKGLEDHLPGTVRATLPDFTGQASFKNHWAPKTLLEVRLQPTGRE